MEFLIKPRFVQLRNALFFETERLNALLNAEYNENFGFYQSTFGVYSYMQLTSELTFRIHYHTATPFLWQSHKNCSWTPTGTISMDQMEITPCKAKLNEQFCYDEYFNSTYKAFLQWSSNPTIGFSAAGQQANDMLVRTLMKNATLGARMTLTAGKLHDLSTIEFNNGVSTRIEDAFRQTAGTCKGWIELAVEMALTPGLEHLDGGYIKPADISADGKDFVGDGRDIVGLYDEIFADCPDPLRDALIEGGVGAFGNQFWPMFLVGLPEYRAVDTAWKAQKLNPLQNEPRITRRPFEFEGRTLHVFFIDDTVVIPITEVSQYDKYLTGTSHFAYLTLSGVVQLGGSFSDLPRVGQAEVSVMMQMSLDAEDYGTHKFLAHSLMATAINDTDYLCGSYAYATPA